MKKSIRFSAAGPQFVTDALKSRLMQFFTFLCLAYYILFCLSSFLRDSNLYAALALMLVNGFMTAECLMLYQRREERNLKHLSVFCLLGMIVMFLACLFFLAVVITLNTEYNAQTEEIVQLWTEADLGRGMPYMILTVVSMGLSGAALLFLWKALGMSANLMKRQGGGRNWFLPAAIALGLEWAAALFMNVSSFLDTPGDWMGLGINGVMLARNLILTLLMAQTAREYKEKIG